MIISSKNIWAKCRVTQIVVEYYETEDERNILNKQYLISYDVHVPTLNWTGATCALHTVHHKLLHTLYESYNYKLLCWVCLPPKESGDTTVFFLIVNKYSCSVYPAGFMPALATLLWHNDLIMLHITFGFYCSLFLLWNESVTGRLTRQIEKGLVFLILLSFSINSNIWE